MNDEIDKSFDLWLKKRKITWRKNRLEKRITRIFIDPNEDDEESTIQHDFWLASGYESFHQWLSSSKKKWRRSYSWHKARRKKLQTESEKEVHFPIVGAISSTIQNRQLLEQFEHWLKVRKHQANRVKTMHPFHNKIQTLPIQTRMKPNL